MILQPNKNNNLQNYMQNKKAFKMEYAYFNTVWVQSFQTNTFNIDLLCTLTVLLHIEIYRFLTFYTLDDYMCWCYYLEINFERVLKSIIYRLRMSVLEAY